MRIKKTVFWCLRKNSDDRFDDRRFEKTETFFNETAYKLSIFEHIRVTVAVAICKLRNILVALC